LPGSNTPAYYKIRNLQAKKFYNIWTWCKSYKISHSRNLQMAIISSSVSSRQTFPAWCNVCG